HEWLLTRFHSRTRGRLVKIVADDYRYFCDRSWKKEIQILMPRRKSNLGRRTEGSRRRLLNMTEEERASVGERNRLSTIQ
ncbi:unnamed protein product, partial [Larinioides sclopetarius]